MATIYDNAFSMAS